MAARILIVDDDHALQTLLNVLLTRAGFECEFLSDGKTAIDKIDAGGYAVIVLDLILPGMSGLEILDRLHASNSAALRRTIVMTGASTGIMRNVDDSLVHSVIRKPFGISDMLQLATDCAFQNQDAH